jgi:hypothetical protein
VLTGDSVLKKSPSSIVKISFSAITHFELRAVPFLPKCGVLTFNGGKMRIPLRTENVVCMIEQLQRRVTVAGLNNVFTNDSAENFRRIALCAHISDRRLTKRLPLLIRIAGLFLCIIMVTARYSWQFPFVLTFLWGIYGLFLFGLAVVVAETVLLRMSISKLRHTKQAHRYGDETRVYLLTAIVGIIVVCASGMALTNLLGE